MLSLYQFPISHYCEKVRWALDHKQLDYRGVNFLPGFHVTKAKKLSGRTSVPILVHDDRVIRNSSDIITYLDTTFPEHPLTPADEPQKQEALEWERFADREVGPYVRRVCYHTLLEYPALVIPFFTLGGPWYGPWLLRPLFPALSKKMRKLMNINAASAQQGQEHLVQVLDKVHEHLQGKTYFVGDRFSRADLAVASLLAPLCRPAGYGLDWPPGYPEPLAQFVEAQSEKLAWVNRLYKQHR
ncbi:MAG TPA: glutathione S-transferase family protein [Gammaproteobacteria bacterium]|nr:glutathione S-transferase family protein [Gammaproteobacteria bacterium]